MVREGKWTLAQIPRRAASWRETQRSMPLLWTRITSASKGEAGATARTPASRSARISRRLLVWSLKPGIVSSSLIGRNLSILREYRPLRHATRVQAM